MCVWIVSQLKNLLWNFSSAKHFASLVVLWRGVAHFHSSVYFVDAKTFRKSKQSSRWSKKDWPSPGEPCHPSICSWNYLCRSLSPGQGYQSCIYLLSWLADHAMHIQVQGSLCKQPNNQINLRKYDCKSRQAPKPQIGRYSRCSSHSGADVGDIIRK